jgi:hypothetical protein
LAYASPDCKRDGKHQIVMFAGAFGSEFQAADWARGRGDTGELANQRAGFLHVAHDSQTAGFEQDLQAREELEFGDVPDLSIEPLALTAGDPDGPDEASGSEARSNSTTGAPTPQTVAGCGMRRKRPRR